MKLCFTFDDGPVGTLDTSYSIRIQNVLKKYGANATFFYWCNRITDDNRAEIRRAYDLGFEIGNHTYTHPALTNLTPEEIKEEIEHADALLTEITGEHPTFVRPPYLAMNEETAALIPFPMINCSIDTRDWDKVSTQEIIDKVLTQAHDGAIILMHETYPTTADAVEYLVPELKKRGVEIVSVSELFRAAGITPEPHTLYHCLPL